MAVNEHTLKQFLVYLTPSTPLCYGVDCHLHKCCARYMAIDDAGDHANWMMSCGREAHRPLFFPVVEEEENIEDRPW